MFYLRWDNNWDFREVKDNNNNNNKIPTASRLQLHFSLRNSKQTMFLFFSFSNDFLVNAYTFVFIYLYYVQEHNSGEARAL